MELGERGQEGFMLIMYRNVLGVNTCVEGRGAEGVGAMMITTVCV